MRPLLLATTMTLIVIALSAAPASAQWPNTCIEMNDALETSLGNFDNVGIYQNTFDDQAELACRNEHRSNVRKAFAWAFDSTGDTIGESEPADTADPLPPESEHAFEVIRDVPIARGADEQVARAIAVSVLMSGHSDDYLRGVFPEVPFGAYACHRQSEQCPLSPPPPYDVVNWTWRWIEQEGACWTLGVKFDIVNNRLEWLQFSWVENALVDKDGFVLDKIVLYDIDVAPHSMYRVSESKQLCDGLGAAYETLTFNAHER